MTQVTVRKAIPADASTIGALHATSWSETYATMLPESMLADLSNDTRTAMWSNILYAPGAHGCIAIVAAEVDGTIVGFGACAQQRDATLARNGFDAEVGAIYVGSSSQGRGVGRALMIAMADALAAEGHRAASLWVLRDNMSARAFYERLGGTVVGERAEAHADITLTELAYGWPDVARIGV